MSKKYIEYFDFNVSQPKVKNKELAILSKYEHSKLINYIQLTFDINKIGVLLSLFMGVRIGEVCALKWEDVNFQTETLRINKTMQRIKNLDEKAITKTKIVIDTPKSQKSIREIPIPSFIVNLMKKYKTDKEKSPYKCSCIRSLRILLRKSPPLSPVLSILPVPQLGCNLHLLFYPLYNLRMQYRFLF